MRRLNRLNRSWAWVEEKVLQIPSYTLDITNDATWDPSSTKPNDTHDIYHDFAHPWPALSTWPDRDASTSPGSPKYRLAIFIHVHPTISARGTVQKSQGVYSVSIWDREVCTSSVMYSALTPSCNDYDSANLIFRIGKEQ